MQGIKLICAKALKIILQPPALRKCAISKKAHICAGSELNNVSMGKYSYVGNHCFMVNVEIGNFCSIADKVSIGGAIHAIDRVSSSPVFHKGRNVLKTNFTTFCSPDTAITVIKNDVWIGMGCYIKQGVTIGNGAVIGMGSVVTHDVPDFEIWAGNPAKKIRDRFDDKSKKMILQSKWWDWGEERICLNADYFESVEKFSEIKE